MNPKSTILITASTTPPGEFAWRIMPTESKEDIRIAAQRSLHLLCGSKLPGEIGNITTQNRKYLSLSLSSLKTKRRTPIEKMTTSPKYHYYCSPLFLRLLAVLELPETEESVVRVVTLLLPLLLDLKLKPDLALWKEWVLLFLKRLPPLLVELTFLWARLWLLLSLSVRLSDMEEEVVVLDLPILSLLFLSISLSL